MSIDGESWIREFSMDTVRALAAIQTEMTARREIIKDHEMRFRTIWDRQQAHQHRLMAYGKRLAMVEQRIGSPSPKPPRDWLSMAIIGYIVTVIILFVLLISGLMTADQIVTMVTGLRR